MVKCADCGFLTFGGRSTAQGQEATAHARRPDGLGRLPNYHTQFPDPYELNSFPRCWVDAFDLKTEARDAAEAVRNTGAEWVNPVHRERDCPKWTLYTPGFTPKEHFERGETLALAQRQREHDLELAKMQAGIASQNKDIAAALLTVQTQSNEQADNTANLALKIALIALIVGLIAGVAQVGSFVLDWLTFARPSPGL